MERDNLMHGARTALNTNQDIRAWAEEYLKQKTRGENPSMTDEEFESDAATVAALQEIERDRTGFFGRRPAARRGGGGRWDGVFGAPQADAVREDAQLEAWVRRGVACARALPAK